jgi:hypothetical protein
MVAPCAQNQPPRQCRHPDNVRDSIPRVAGGGPAYWANDGVPPTEQEMLENIDLIRILEELISRDPNAAVNQTIQNYREMQPLH